MRGFEAARAAGGVSCEWQRRGARGLESPTARFFALRHCSLHGLCGALELREYLCRLAIHTFQPQLERCAFLAVMQKLSGSLLLVLIVTLLLPSCVTIDCIAGYGQRGLAFSNGISWQRACPRSRCCFEATTADMKEISSLFEYELWDSYYYQFWVKGCCGDFG
jgi:hypothetical protein